MDALGILGAVGVVMTIAAAAYVGVQSGVQTNLRQQLEDERKLNASLKGERSDLQANVARLSSEMAALRGIVTGEVHWNSISDLLEHHHDLAEQHWARAETTMEAIRDTLMRRET